MWIGSPAEENLERKHVLQFSVPTATMSGLWKLYSKCALMGRFKV